MYNIFNVLGGIIMNEEYTKWLVANVPFFEKLSKDEAEELRKLWDDFQRWLSREQQIFSDALKPSSAGIDRTNNFDKSGQRRIAASTLLNQYVADLEEKYCLNSSSAKKHL